MCNQTQPLGRLLRLHYLLHWGQHPRRQRRVQVLCRGSSAARSTLDTAQARRLLCPRACPLRGCHPAARARRRPPPTFCRCSRREVWVSLIEKNMGPSSASHSGSTAVTHCGCKRWKAWQWWARRMRAGRACPAPASDHGPGVPACAGLLHCPCTFHSHAPSASLLRALCQERAALFQPHQQQQRMPTARCSELHPTCMYSFVVNTSS